MAIALTLTSQAAWAGDPFRSSNPKPIGDQTEAAFRAMFQDGDYKRAEELLATAEPNEPMAYAMRGAIAYLEHDWDILSNNADQTLETAEQLMATDPMRGNLYLAVGYFLQGGYILKTEGTFQGTPTALRKLQLVFDHIAEAERLAPDDPELNLIKGYMDLLIAVNLPFTNPDQAIERLVTYAAPTYLSQRGVAIAYRDLEETDAAMSAIDQALAEAPENPELLYLKAQILVEKGQDADSLEFFNEALDHAEQLPYRVAGQIFWEQCRAENRVTDEQRNCEREQEKFEDDMQ
jgi:tetratricopeptide (TPR) repeat protein